MAFGNDFFDRLPNDMTRLVFSYLQEESNAVIATACTCKKWEANPILQEERGKAANRLYTRIYLQKNVLGEMLTLQKDYKNQQQAVIDQITMSNIGSRRVVLDFDDRIFTPSQITNTKKCNKTLRKVTIAVAVASVFVGSAGYFLKF